MNEERGSITRTPDGSKWIVKAEGYRDKELQDTIAATRLYLLRTNPEIGILLHNLIQNQVKDNYAWAVTAAKAAMTAAEGMVLRPPEDAQNIVAQVPNYDSPEWNHISYWPEAQTIQLQCTCLDWRVAYRGAEQNSDVEAEPVAITGNGIYCKHILAYLMIARSRRELGYFSPVSEAVAIIVVVMLRHHYITELGGDGTPDWVYQMKAVKMHGQHTLMFSVPEEMMETVEKKENTAAIEEMLRQVYPKLTLTVHPVKELRNEEKS